MKLYYAPGACSLSPHIVLTEAGLTFDKIKVDGKTKAMDGGGDYRTVNPLGYVPLLELDELISDVYPVTRAMDALNNVRARNGIKTAIKPH